MAASKDLQNTDVLPSLGECLRWTLSQVNFPWFDDLQEVHEFLAHQLRGSQCQHSFCWQLPKMSMLLPCAMKLVQHCLEVLFGERHRPRTSISVVLKLQTKLWRSRLSSGLSWGGVHMACCLLRLWRSLSCGHGLSEISGIDDVRSLKQQV